MKICKICKVNKDLSEYWKCSYRKEGYLGQCKDCDRLKNRLYRERNKEKSKEKYKRYYQLHKEEIKKKRLDWYHSHKNKFSAHQKVKNALFRGDLIKLSCQECGDKKSLAHHPDYSKPLEVIWLCSKHHMRLHHGK